MRSLLAAAFLVLAPVSAEAADCSDVLAPHLVNRSVNLSNRTAYAALSEWYCSDHYTAFSKQSGINITIPIEGVPIGVGGTASRSTVSRDQFCASNQRVFSESQFSYVATQIVPPEAITAWSTCMARENPKLEAVLKTGFEIADRETQQTINFSLEYKPTAMPGTNFPAAWVVSFGVDGATCPNVSVPAGTALPPNSKLGGTCTRPDRRAVVINILTTIGLARISVPANTDGLKYASCKVVTTIASTQQTPVPELASAGCGTGGGGIKSCSVTVSATSPDYVLTLDKHFVRCDRLTGHNPCAFVRQDPAEGQPPTLTSARTAIRKFTTDSDQVFLTQFISQAKLVETFGPPQEGMSFDIIRGRIFTVERLKKAASVRLQCQTVDGDSIIKPIAASGADISERIRFVSKDDTDPVFGLYTFRVE